MTKLVKIQVLGADGNPLANQDVWLTAHGDRKTNANGLTQYLVEDISDAELQLGGAGVWSGSTSDLNSLEVFKQSGKGFSRG